MSEPIKPALTSEQWAALPVGDLSLRADDYEIDVVPAMVPVGAIVINGREYLGGDESDTGMAIIPESARHAVAAVCLDGYTFGFTREDVALLRLLEAQHEWSQRGHARSLADRIEALLPPTP